MESYKTLGYFVLGAGLATLAALAPSCTSTEPPEKPGIAQQYQGPRGLGERLKLARQERSKLISELQWKKIKF